MPGRGSRSGVAVHSHLRPADQRQQRRDRRGGPAGAAARRGSPRRGAARPEVMSKRARRTDVAGVGVVEQRRGLRVDRHRRAAGGAVDRADHASRRDSASTSPRSAARPQWRTRPRGARGAVGAVDEDLVLRRPWRGRGSASARGCQRGRRPPCYVGRGRLRQCAEAARQNDRPTPTWIQRAEKSSEPGVPPPPELPRGFLAIEVDPRSAAQPSSKFFATDHAQRDRAERGETRVGGVGLPGQEAGGKRRVEVESAARLRVGSAGPASRCSPAAAPAPTPPRPSGSRRPTNRRGSGRRAAARRSRSGKYWFARVSHARTRRSSGRVSSSLYGIAEVAVAARVREVRLDDRGRVDAPA